MLRRVKQDGSGGSPTSATASVSSNTNNNQLTFVECENRVQELLSELHDIIKDTQKQREEGNNNLETIGKTHEKMQGEAKLSTYFKQKLRNLYSVALDDADVECDLLKKGLDIIAKIKALQEEKRIAARLSSYNPLDDQPRKSMRRGVLMSMLQKSAQTLPLWIGKPNEKVPPLCGAVSAGPDYIAKPGDKVAARVRTDEAEEQWILAEVVSFNSSLQKYEVDDIDEEGREHHVLSKRRVVPLAQWKANPETDPEALFPKGALVMALYPQTTCFYRAVISKQPTTAHEDYSVLFEDNSYADGYSPALRVAQKYLVVPKEMRELKRR
uniref:SAGA-associated factor 29-like n=1 Tax=Ciona intestinalis TaxID=7719 RepID=UPI000180CF83|nr:SAGA-associated factor 29-like [Ciona intestinalis]XP_002131736.1 SAGA-associated factor 29-like [Ciona intestinalis]XP_026691831.1 SAGA-associated factor 29-like [Ciona intestinalis]|eukprot:XP_002131731.1 SAGA-associated factor 29-like [Ciona intestinalis]